MRPLDKTQKRAYTILMGLGDNMTLIVAHIPNRFKTEQGVRLTRGLFYETTLLDKSTVLYTLKTEDHQGYSSLYRLYMEIGDPTEYKFAQAYLDGWDHWEVLTKSTWFIPHVERWRRELQVRGASEALSRISEIAKANDKNAFAANKFLLETKKKNEVGRPSKEAVREAAEKHFSDINQIDEDAKRLNLN